jgi:hypothetical protein
LDYISWSVDDTLYKIMNHIWIKEDKVLTSRVQEWVKTNDIKPKLQVGAVVKYIKHTTQGKQYHEGTIIGIIDITAKYAVNIPSLGHKVRESYKIEFERLEEWNEK